MVPTAADYPQIVEQVLTAEREGLDLVGIQDHPYQRRFLDTFALIADLLARTSRLRFFPDVASLPMRGPTMLAKAAASLDVMSNGRFELGIGAGAFWDAVAGMGGPRRTNAEAFDALEEAIPIIRAALDVGPERRVVRGPGPHYPVPGYPPGPPPAHRVEIWVGAYRRRGLELIGRMADGWVPSVGYVGPEACARRRPGSTRRRWLPGAIRAPSAGSTTSVHSKARSSSGSQPSPSGPEIPASTRLSTGPETPGPIRSTASRRRSRRQCDRHSVFEEMARAAHA